MADEVYLSVFDKADGKRITSYTIMGEIHGKTMNDLRAKAAASYPDDYAVPQTREDWRRTVSNDLRWNGSELVNPPEPTAEELQNSMIWTIRSLKRRLSKIPSSRTNSSRREMRCRKNMHRKEVSCDE